MKETACHNIMVHTFFLIYSHTPIQAVEPMVSRIELNPSLSALADPTAHWSTRLVGHQGQGMCHETAPRRFYFYEIDRVAAKRRVD